MSQISAPEHSLVEQVLAADVLSVSGMQSSSDPPPMTDNEFQNFLLKMPLSTTSSVEGLWGVDDIPLAATQFPSVGPSSSPSAAVCPLRPYPTGAAPSRARSSAAETSPAGPSGARTSKITVSTQATHLAKSSSAKESGEAVRSPLKKTARHGKTSSPSGNNLPNEPEGKKAKHPSYPTSSRGAGPFCDSQSEKIKQPNKPPSSVKAVPPY